MTRRLQGSLEKVFSGSRVPLRREPEVDRGTGGIDGSVQIGPDTRHRNVCFVHPPRAVGGFQIPTASFIEFRRISLHPAPNGRVVRWQTAFGQKFLDVAIGEGIAQIPPDRAKNDGWFKVSPFKQSRPRFAHGTSLTKPPADFATLPFRKPKTAAR